VKTRHQLKLIIFGSDFELCFWSPETFDKNILFDLDKIFRKSFTENLFQITLLDSFGLI